MAALRRLAPSIACILCALLVLWGGAWLMPDAGHWALFPAFMTTFALSFGCLMAAIYLWPGKARP